MSSGPGWLRASVFGTVGSLLVIAFCAAAGARATAHLLLGLCFGALAFATGGVVGHRAPVFGVVAAAAVGT